MALARVVGSVLETKVLLCFHCLRLLLVVDSRLDVSRPTGGCDKDRREDELLAGDSVLLRMTGMVAITAGAFRRTTGRCEEDETDGTGAVDERCTEVCDAFGAGGSLKKAQPTLKTPSVARTNVMKLDNVPFHDRRFDFPRGNLGHSAGIL